MLLLPPLPYVRGGKVFYFTLLDVKDDAVLLVDDFTAVLCVYIVI